MCSSFLILNFVGLFIGIPLICIINGDFLWHPRGLFFRILFIIIIQISFNNSSHVVWIVRSEIDCPMINIG